MSPDRSGRGRERRRHDGPIKQKPRSSPASFVVLTVAGVLIATAAAAALLGDGFTDETPHGRLLGTLQDVARAQESHYTETGRFAGWIGALEVSAAADVDVRVLHGDASRWEAVATAPDVGLTCSQEGAARAGVPERMRPVCFVPGE